MKKLITITTLALLVAITLMSQSGCEKEAEDSTSESNRLLELLSIVPANDNTLKAVYLNDWEYLRERIEQYPEIPLEYTIGHAHPLIGSHSYNEEEWQQTLTFTIEDVEQSIFAGIPPPYSSNNYEVVRAGLNPEEVDNAMRTGPLNDILEIVTYQGHEFYSWGGDNESDRSWWSNVRWLGKGYRLALVDDFLCWVVWTDGIKEMIDSYEDRIDSLADVEEYQLLADGLIELDVCEAFFSTEPQSRDNIIECRGQRTHDSDPELYQRFLESIDGPVYLEPFQAFATGAGLDEQGFYMVIVLLNPDEETARNNATLLEQRINRTISVGRGLPWTDLIESTEIQSDGRLTIAKLYGAICTYWDWFDMHGDWAYEPLLMYE